MTKACHNAFSAHPELNQMGNCFMIKDARQNTPLFAFRVILPSFLPDIPKGALDESSTLELQKGYALVQFPKLNLSIENNQVLRNQLYEMCFGALYFYCQQNKIERLVTQLTVSGLANKLLLRLGFVQDLETEWLRLEKFSADAKPMNIPQQHFWNERYELVRSK